jgi:serine/threonine-protein kinase HipA
MLTLVVYSRGAHVGTLSHEPNTQRWAFAYEPTWLGQKDRFALCPTLPLRPDPSRTAEQHSDIVRIFFENLLPEGRALDEAAASQKLSKANSFGLLNALGRETTGALEILNSPEASDTGNSLRRVSRTSLSERIRERPHLPFTIWDGRVRLSIAGYQDKLAVLEKDDEWFLVEGRQVASTHILKPEPLTPSLAALTTNERLCMLLAKRVGLSAASTRLEHVPEPVLIVERFDRRRVVEGIERLHCIDGCQALGLPVALKYERPYGNGEHVRHIRDGANLPRLFALLRAHAWMPARECISLLRWVIFQTLIGNVDGHAKNLSFFSSARGLCLAPAYDMVCGLAYEQAGFEDTFAMAIGDEFAPRALTAYDWALFSNNCGLTPRLVCREIVSLATACIERLSSVAEVVRQEGGSGLLIDRVCNIIRAQAQHALAVTPAISETARREKASGSERHVMQRVHHPFGSTVSVVAARVKSTS